MQHLDEEAGWVQATLQGDQQAFARIVERYNSAIFNLCYRMLGNPQDAEDAAQESFIRAYTRLQSYDSERRLSTWLLSIASNHCIDRLRRRKFAWMDLDDVAFWLPSDSPGPERSALEQEQADQVQQALNRLSEKYRLVLVLRYWHDMSYEEIGSITGLSESALKTRLHRARKQLGTLLEQNGATQWDAETTTS